MDWSEADPYTYHPERGLYYHEVWKDVFCGSQPQSRQDIQDLTSLLGAHGSIISLQQEKDLEYWGVQGEELRSEADQRGLAYTRCPAQDFDPHSLRGILPTAVRKIEQGLASGGKVYVHCTAGLGRAPAACIAYLYWFHDFQLEGAYKHVTDIRPCGPKKDAVRGATYDLLDGRPWDQFFHIPEFSYSELNAKDKDNLRNKLNQLN